MINQLQIGALELCLTLDHSDPLHSLVNVVELSAQLECIGYSRFWISEHHHTQFAQTSPIVLLPMIGACTSQIKIGIGGLLLSLYSPLRIANDCCLLATLFPGRVEIGLGRGKPPADRIAHMIENDDGSTYQAKVRSLLTFLDGTSQVRPIPACTRPPDIWLLGSQVVSRQLSEEVGLPYMHALFLQQSDGLFGGSIEGCGLAVSGVCADTNIAALRAIYSNHQIKVIPTVYGGRAEVSNTVRELIIQYRPSSIMFMDLSMSYPEKLNSYRIFQEVCSEVDSALDFRSPR